MARKSSSPDYGKHNDLGYDSGGLPNDDHEPITEGVFSRLMRVKDELSTENGKHAHVILIIVECLDIVMRGVCATREVTRNHDEVCLRLHELLESKDKKIKDVEKTIREIIGQLRELKSELVQAESKLAMQESLIARLKIEADDRDKVHISYNGVLMWEIDNYRERKRDAKSGERPSFYSNDFYNDFYGYRMCARVYLNGDGVGKNTHLSIFFAVKKGKNDDILKWPFGLRVKFSLLNQSGRDNISDAFRPDPNSSSFQKPVRDINVASGCPMFVSQQVVENDGFLKNNRIWLKVTVEQP